MLHQCLHDSWDDYCSVYMTGEMITAVLTRLLRWLLQCLHDWWDVTTVLTWPIRWLLQCLHDWWNDYCSAYMTGEMIAPALTWLMRWLLQRLYDWWDYCNTYTTGEITAALMQLLRWLLQHLCNWRDAYCSTCATGEMITAAFTQLVRCLLQRLFRNLCCVKVCAFPAVIHNARSMDQMEFMDILLWRCGSVVTFFPILISHTHIQRRTHTHTDSHLQNNNSCDHFYSTVSHQQGWAHHALQDQQIYIHKTSTTKNYIVIILYF